MADKYFQLVVPNYDRSGSSTRGAPLSYLRLGRRLEADALPARDDRGDELVEHLAFEDDERSPTLPGKAYVRDDGAERESRSGEEAAEFREELTEDLLDRGGWRDHTDGNRISTTRGDCVEVVGGNYKLCVLGRVAHRWDPEQDDAGNGATANPNVKRCWWESAGGHSIEAASCGE